MPSESIVADPLWLLVVISKGELLDIPSTSLAVICPEIGPPSSSPLPEVLPVTTVELLTALTVIFISCVSVLPSSSVIVTAKVSVPLKFSFGV